MAARCCVIVLMLLSFAAVAPADDRFSPIAQQLIDRINANDQPGIQALFSADMQKALPPAKSAPVFVSLIQQRGKMMELDAPRVEGNTAFFTVKCERGSWDLQLTLMPDSKIGGLRFTEPKPKAPMPPRNSMPLRLPFSDEWTVMWGGDNPTINYHANTPNQRRALDIIITDAAGKSHKGAGDRNEDYLCYGKPILAPADAKVVMVIDGIPDNKPGSMNSFCALGNCVELQLAPDEFAFFCHLVPASAKVKVGDTVKAGDTLGACGNSGNSSEPHLHFHLQNTLAIQDGTGFAPFFKNISLTRMDKTTTEDDCSPVKGDRIKPGK